MTKTLVIAEKPSVARDIVQALTSQSGKFEKSADYFENAHYIVTSAVGHLLEIEAPAAYEVKRGKWSFTHLPVIPPHFDIKPIEKTRARLAAVTKLLKRKDVSRLVNACDAGREGELIFRLIAQYADVRHPVSRLWLQSMTPQAIREGFANLRPDAQMQPLADAARCRSEADWLVGINGTRAMTAFNSRDGGFFLTTVGRVQTPTLAVVVEREELIRQFVARPYWELHALFTVESGSYTGRWIDPHWRKGDDEHARAERQWNQQTAHAIAQDVRGHSGSVTEESKPATQASPLLFDLTSLQREANARFGFSAKTTLALAQSLYERHKVLTYPRTDSRALPEDYLSVAKKTFEMFATSGMDHLAPHARKGLQAGYVKPSRRIFDNSKVSDHFAIIPTLEAPQGLSEAEQKLYDLVARRFLAVFFPSAQYLVTTRMTRVQSHTFKTEGRVLVEAGWLVIYGRGGERDEVAQEGGQELAAVRAGEQAHCAEVEVKAFQTKPPARYSEATLLGAMEGAGKLVDDDELRDAMEAKGLGTPATRAAIIEGLLSEKYLLREGRELIPTAKAFQLMTLLRGLDVQELCKPALTGEWEYKLAQMERGQISRQGFMQEIASMTARMVEKAKTYDRDTVPGNYVTLTTPCPGCGGVIKENYRRYACVGTGGQDGAGAGAGCGFSFTKTPAGRTFELGEPEQFVRTGRLGPLEGFRSKAGWPFVAELVLVRDPESNHFKLEFDFGNTAREAMESGELLDLSARQTLGSCPKCGAGVYALGNSYHCAQSVPTVQQSRPTCDFKSGRVILQQPVEPEQMQKLLATGRTDLLEHFISMRTRRAFKAFLVWNSTHGKVGFEFVQNDKGRKVSRERSTGEESTASSSLMRETGGASKNVSKTRRTGRKAASTRTVEEAAAPSLATTRAAAGAARTLKRTPGSGLATNRVARKGSTTAGARAK